MHESTYGRGHKETRHEQESRNRILSKERLMLHLRHYGVYKTGMNERDLEAILKRTVSDLPSLVRMIDKIIPGVLNVDEGRDKLKRISTTLAEDTIVVTPIVNVKRLIVDEDIEARLLIKTDSDGRLVPQSLTIPDTGNSWVDDRLDPRRAKAARIIEEYRDVGGELNTPLREILQEKLKDDTGIDISDFSVNIKQGVAEVRVEDKIIDQLRNYFHKPEDLEGDLRNTYIKSDLRDFLKETPRAALVLGENLTTPETREMSFGALAEYIAEAETFNKAMGGFGSYLSYFDEEYQQFWPPKWQEESESRWDYLDIMWKHVVKKHTSFTNEIADNIEQW